MISNDHEELTGTYRYSFPDVDSRKVYDPSRRLYHMLKLGMGARMGTKDFLWICRLFDVLLRDLKRVRVGAGS